MINFFQIRESFGQITNLTECHHELTVANETETTIWLEYQEKLEKYSGLGVDNHTIDVNCENNTKCIINRDGAAVWETRLEIML